MRRISLTVTLHLKPEVEASLAEQARARGMALEDYLLWLAENASASGVSEPEMSPSARENAVRQMLEFGDRYHLTLGEAVTRNLLHEGHRF